MLPRYEPVPPRIDAPPMATAAIEVNRYESPMPRYDCFGIAREQDPGERRRGAADGIGDDRRANHRDPGEHGHGPVAAHRVEMASEGASDARRRAPRRRARARRRASRARRTTRPLASHCSTAGEGGGGKPRVTTSSSPESTTFVASVMTMGGMRRRAMPRPLMVPTAAPPTRISGTAHTSATSLLRVSAVTRIAAPVEHPRHRQVDAAADDDHRLADGHDADERGADDERGHVRGCREAGRVEADEAEQGARPRSRRASRAPWSGGPSGSGSRCTPRAGHAVLSMERADSASAAALATTTATRMSPIATGCQ